MYAAVCLLLAVACAGVSAQRNPNATGPLADYVYTPDPTFAWQATTTIKGFDYDVHNIYLVSQTWLTANDSSQPVWSHWLQICVPHRPLVTDTAWIYLDGGSSPSGPSNPPTGIDDFSVAVCSTVRTVAAHLSAIPNEPILFYGDPKHQWRSEDAIIAYTWAHFINNTNEPDWLLRMPMTKAGVAALNAMEQFVATLPNVTPITKFVVAGASKRGWTTWTVAGVDSRVIGAIPIVAPVGNLVPQINEMYQSYNGFSFALDDYIDEGVIQYLNNEVFKELLGIVAPDAFYNTLTMPKLVICDCGDEFFMPDGIGYMWPYLTGEKIVRIIPNAEHSLTGHQFDLFFSDVSAWYLSILKNRPRPSISWEFQNNGTKIVATLEAGPTGKIVTPSKVLMFHAYNSKARDFRLITCADVKNPACLNPILWGPQQIYESSPNVWTAELAAPSKGYAAFLIEFEFADIGGFSILDPMKITTSVSTIPQELPFPPCGAACDQNPPPPPAPSESA